MRVIPLLVRLGASVDGLLRGRYTRESDLAAGRIEIPARTLVIAGLALGVTYGAFMGLFALLRGGWAGFAQWLITMLKVPLLFLLTLGVTFPSLYVTAALTNSPLAAWSTLRLLLAVSLARTD